MVEKVLYPLAVEVLLVQMVLALQQTLRLAPGDEYLMRPL